MNVDTNIPLPPGENCRAASGCGASVPDAYKLAVASFI